MRIRLAIAALILLTAGGISGRSGGDTGTCLGRDAFAAQVEIDACTRVLETLPASHARRAELLAHRGQAFYKLRNYDAAIDDLEGAVAERDVAEWHYWRGQAYHFAGETDDAMAAYTRAIEIDDDTPGAWINRAVLRGLKRDRNGAIEDLTHVLERHPDHIVALTNRSLFYLEIRNFTAALADADQTLALAPRTQGAMLARAASLVELHRFDDAIATAGEALAQGAPLKVIFLSVRARAYVEKGAFDLARADIETGEVLQNPCLACLDARLLLHLRRKEFEDAVKVGDRYIELMPGFAVGWNNRCYARAGAGQAKAALADCDRAIALDPNLLHAFNSRAVAHLKLRDAKAALADFEHALAQGDRSGFSQYGRGLARLRLGQRKEGQADLDTVNAADPRVAEDFTRFGLRP